MCSCAESVGEILPDDIKDERASVPLVYIALFCTDWATKVELVDATGCSKRTVERSLGLLSDRGYLASRWGRQNTGIREYRLVDDD